MRTRFVYTGRTGFFEGYQKKKKRRTNNVNALRIFYILKIAQSIRVEYKEHKGSLRYEEACRRGRRTVQSLRFDDVAS